MIRFVNKAFVERLFRYTDYAWCTSPVLVPTRDDLVVRDWRRDARSDHELWLLHKYPSRGCQGERIGKPCDGHHDEQGAFCAKCNNTGTITPQGWDTTACG